MRRSTERGQAYPPRGMGLKAAADWIGVSTDCFERLVADGRMPRPRQMYDCLVWDRHQLDAAFDALPDSFEQALELDRSWNGPEGG